MNEDKRINDRRRGARRMYDIHDEMLLDEDKRMYDKLLYSRYLEQDRRGNTRRTDTDRRSAWSGQEDTSGVH